jgi:hypothetical protein
MPLQNRVKPNGEIVATPERGTMMGNRGGKFHHDDQTLGKRRWASTHWICCDLKWKDQHHEPMGQGYTSLFFLDEVTALSAGHRPCFYCRRQEAKKFLGDVKVKEFDQQLHTERVAKSPLRPSGTSPSRAEGGRKLMRSPNLLGELSEGLRGSLPHAIALPNGTMFERDSTFFALKNQCLLLWSFSGYTKSIPFTPMKVLTPPSIIAILQSGYEPRWHESAKQWD